MKFFDRLLTIVITATLTSAVWIVFGSALMDLAEGDGGKGTSEPALENVRATPPPPKVEPPTTAEPSASPAPEQESASADPAAVTEAVETALAIPVDGVRAGDLTDSFLDPRGPNAVRRHEAIDIMAPKGTSVTAAAPGRIAKIHRSDAGGKSVYVRSLDKRTLYFYAHLDRYAKGLKEGQKIDLGEAIGTVGSSGNAAPDAPHLHFAVFQTTQDAEWWEPANAVNPYPLLTEPVG